MIMASSMTKPAQVKRLGELLQEQQEPFLLHDYLLERGYSKKIQNCKSTKKYPHCSKILRSMLNKLQTAYGKTRKASNCNSGADADQKSHQVAEYDRYSYATNSSLFDSCSETDWEEGSLPRLEPALEPPTLRYQHEVSAEGTSQWGWTEDAKQHSPISVLEELPFDEPSTVQNNGKTVASFSKTIQRKNPPISSLNLPKRITEEPIFSAALWECLVKSILQKQDKLEATETKDLGTASTASFESLEIKEVLDQTKKLVFDCVLEAVETNRKNRRRLWQGHKFLEDEQLEKLIFEEICLWGKQSGNIRNISKLMSSDFWLSQEEWSDFHSETEETGQDIGDAILEDLKSEIVTDMIDFLPLERC